MSATYIENAKIMSKGQVTIPKDIRDMLNIQPGDRISFIVEGNTVRIVNSAIYAMQVLQSELKDTSSLVNDSIQASSEQ